MVTAGPQAPASTATSAAAEYKVQPGDTLWRISQRFGMSVTELRSVNQLDTSTSIHIGQTLRVGKKGGSEADGPSAKAQAALASLKARTQASEPEAAPKAPSASLQSAPAVTALLPAQSVVPPTTTATTSAPARKKYPFVWPVEGVLTSRFGTREGRGHDGIDIGAAPGSKVKAAADGDVIFADNHRSYGNLVLIRHSNNLVTVYAHNSKNLVNRGQRVKAGQAIALVGSTGHSTGPHLHFEVRRGVTAENPLALLPP
jgi:lipoprotein NlpD